jgi:hypothetical protein
MFALTACTPLTVAHLTPDRTLRWQCPIPNTAFFVYVNDEGKRELPAWNQAQCSPIRVVVP